MRSNVSVLLICVSACLLPFRARAGETLSLDATKRDALGIVVARPDRVDQTSGPALPANVVVPNARLHVVSAPRAGLVEELLVSAGDEVKTGQPIARIRSAELLELEREYLELRTQAALAAANAERDRRLLAEGLVPERRARETQATHQQLATAAAERRQALVLAGIDAAALERLVASGDLSSALTVTSPLDGIVLDQSVTVGERVQGADRLYRIADLTSLWLEIHAPLDRLDGVVPGTPVAIPGLGLQAAVVTVGRAVHGADQGVTVRAEIHTGTEKLRPGQIVSVQLRPAAASRSAYRVPLAAIVRLGDTTYVFLARPEGFVPMAIRVLQEESGSAIVEADLPDDAEIAVRGTASLKSLWTRSGD